MTVHETKPRKKQADGPITIKKYANRRLYNTATSSYVTLDHLCEMVKSGEDFLVFDAKSGEDITRSVLTQIIFEEEGKGQNLLPIQFLRQLIRFYGDSMQAFVPSYLEMSMESFSRNQEEIRSRMHDAFGGGTQALKDFDDMVRQNLSLFQNAFRMFTPFVPPITPGTGSSAEPPRAGDAGDAPEGEKSAEEIVELKSQLAQMQEEIKRLAAQQGSKDPID
ncbi:MAG: polyhydroxyalkanoate synthesis repressor PhaR [Pseudomonadota bacterium]